MTFYIREFWSETIHRLKFSLLVCTAMFSNRCWPMLQGCMLPQSSGRWVSLVRKDSWLCRSPVGWADQWGMDDDGWGTGPMADGWAVQSRREREVRSKLSHLSSGQLTPPPPLGPSLLSDPTLASSRLPLREGLILYCLTVTLYLHPICHWPGSWHHILSHSHTVPLFLFYFGPPTHLPLAQFLTYRHPFPIGQSSTLDSYITSYPFALGSLITLMMEAACTSEKSVDIDLRTRQYIPEDSELHTFRCENIASLCLTVTVGHNIVC
jgi:hypothetical protein